ncbi:hypothetical protein LOTGIDRAFT_154761 [Lottia gigantea]|uniref:G-protein coupled receptors family 2 profile 2 domain-containing protein n=1 Tax=Lottia gigantea TaxID=225164 RepID=V4BEG2_LOTGI|nr:hypothetical protein LOTGIDRAFT_154761 [Lottia gigantea]ESO87259.1 hypothetical protein LOTGIDRAFT_154761 [Lottia gigantea]
MCLTDRVPKRCVPKVLCLNEIISVIVEGNILDDVPCRDSDVRCFVDAGESGYYPNLCNNTNVASDCSYMCGKCKHKIYSDAEVYFPFDDLDDDNKFTDKSGFKSEEISGEITLMDQGRRLGAVMINKSSCLDLGEFDGGHKDSTGIYFGYNRKLNVFIVTVNTKKRQYTASFDESIVPVSSRWFMSIVVTCNFRGNKRNSQAELGLGNQYPPPHVATSVPRIPDQIQNSLENLNFSPKVDNSLVYHEGLKVYIEGELKIHERNYTTIPIDNDYDSARIGCVDKDKPWSNFIRVDEFAFWNRVLKPREVFDVAVANSIKTFEEPINQLDSTVSETNNLETATSVVSSLEQIVKTKPLSHNDIKEMVGLWERLAAAQYLPQIKLSRFSRVRASSDKPVQNTTEESLVSKVSDTIDGVLGKTNRGAVKDLSDKEPESLPNLVEAVDDFLGKVSRYSLQNESNGTYEATEIRDSVEIRVKVDSVSKENYEYQHGSSVILETDNRSSVLLVNVLYKGIGNLFPTDHNIDLQYKHNDSEKTNSSYLELGEDILGMSVYDDDSLVNSNIQYKFKLPEINGSDVYPHCVYLDFKNSSKDGVSTVLPYWTDTGCVLLQVAKDSVTCSCSHLTNFAILMQIVPFEISEKDKMALETITFIGCALSIMGGILTVLTFLFLRIYTNRVMIHMNLAVAIIGAQILMLIEEAIARGTAACTAVTLLLYYFNMSIFSWMLVEGIQLFLQIVVVFTSDSKMKIFYGIGWGAPILLATICLAVLNSDLGQHGVCWLSPHDNSIWAFAVPALAVIFTNLVILVIVMKVVYSMSNTMDKPKLAVIRNAVKASVLLLPLLGCTWLFGVLAVSSETVIFQYLFTVTNTLQGFMLFFCHCVWNTEVRESFMRRKAVWDASRHFRVDPVSQAPRVNEIRHEADGRRRTRRDRAGTPSTDSFDMASTPVSNKYGHRRI